MVHFGEWLSDRHLQYICEARFCHNEVDEPRAYPFLVEQIQAALQDFAADPQQQKSTIVRRRHLCIVNSEANEGLHWFMVAWDGRLPRIDLSGLSALERASLVAERLAVRVVDSMASDAYCGPLVHALRNLGIEPKVDLLGVQEDGWRCGYHACWALEKLLASPANALLTARVPSMPAAYTTQLMQLLEACPSSPTSMATGSDPATPADAEPAKPAWEDRRDPPRSPSPSPSQRSPSPRLPSSVRSASPRSGTSPAEARQPGRRTDPTAPTRAEPSPPPQQQQQPPASEQPASRPRQSPQRPQRPTSSARCPHCAAPNSPSASDPLRQAWPWPDAQFQQRQEPRSRATTAFASPFAAPLLDPFFTVRAPFGGSPLASSPAFAGFGQPFGRLSGAPSLLPELWSDGDPFALARPVPPPTRSTLRPAAAWDTRSTKRLRPSPMMLDDPFFSFW